MVVTIRKTCILFNNLFQIVEDRKRVGFPTTHISVSGVQPLFVVYIEITSIDDFGKWVLRQQELMF